MTAIEHDLELWPGTKRPRQGRFRLTTAGGEVLSLTASEIGTIFLGPGPNRWSDSDAQALAAADASAFGFDQHCWFQLGDKRGVGIVEYMMTGGSRRYNIPPSQIGG